MESGGWRVRASEQAREGGLERQADGCIVLAERFKPSPEARSLVEPV